MDPPMDQPARSRGMLHEPRSSLSPGTTTRLERPAGASAAKYAGSQDIRVPPPARCIRCVRLFIFLVITFSLVGAAIFLFMRLSAPAPTPPTVSHVGFIGNSMLFHNDVPRLLEAMRPPLINDCCFRGGGSIASILADGNATWHSTAIRMSTPNARRADGSFDVCQSTVAELLSSSPWDFVVLNDFSQAPARTATRAEGAEVLINGYAPLFARTHATPVFLMTHAYQHVGHRGTDDLGNTSEFTRLLREGYDEYAEALGRLLPPSQQPIVAPFGTAAALVREEKPALWPQLFDVDGVHLSPSGAYLVAAVLMCSMYGVPAPFAGTALPENTSTLWSKARYMGVPGDPVLPMPSRDDLVYLLGLAERVVTSR